MKNLNLQMPDSIDIEELITGKSLKEYPPEFADILRLDSIVVSEALAEIILGVLRAALSLPEDRRVYLAQQGEPCMAALGAK